MIFFPKRSSAIIHNHRSYNWNGVYNRLVEELVRTGRVDVAKSFFDLMVPKLRMNDDAYKFIMNALSGIGKHDEVVKIVDGMLREDPGDFTEELEDFVRELLRKEGMEDEVTNLKLPLEKEKARLLLKLLKKLRKLRPVLASLWLICCLQSRLERSRLWKNCQLKVKIRRILFPWPLKWRRKWGMMPQKARLLEKNQQNTVNEKVA